MSILENYYKIKETLPTSGALLVSPTIKYFSFDFDNISKENNNATTIFWNFGDPYSTENEIIKSKVSNSMISHVYTYSGTYKVTCIANVGGVPYHLEQFVTI